MPLSNTKTWRPRLGWILALVGIAAAVAALVRFQDRWRPVPESREVAAALQTKRFDEALSLLARRSRSGPLASSDLLMKADAEIQLGRNQEAIADLSLIGDDEPDASRARLAIGQLELWTLHRTPRGEQALLAALRLDPKSIQARRELFKLYDIQGRNAERDDQLRALSESSSLSLNELLAWCRIKRPEGETREVTTLLQRFVAGDSDDQKSRAALARQLLRQGRLDEAEAAIAALPERSNEAISLRVRLDAERGDRIDEEVKPGTQSGASAELSRLRGRHALLNRDGNAALLHFREAQELEPGDRETLMGLGQSCRLLNDEASASRWLGRVAEIDALESLVQRVVTGRNQKDVRLIHQIAELCEKLGRNDQAMAWYGYALGVDPLNTVSQRALYRLRQSAEGPGSARTE